MKQTLTCLFLVMVSSLFYMKGICQTTLTGQQRKEFANLYGSEDVPKGIQEIKRFQMTEQIQYQKLERQLLKINPLLTATKEDKELKSLIIWHEYSLEMSKIDHTSNILGNFDQYAEQLGPHKASRSLAITHLAMLEAINTVLRKFFSYHGLQAKILADAGLADDVSRNDVSIAYAIASAATETLKVLYPKKSELIEARLNDFAGSIGFIPESQKQLGIQLGKSVAKAVIADRSLDNSDYREPDVSSNTPIGIKYNKWQKDPLSNINAALGGNWNLVTPFILEKSDQFRPTPPPAFSDSIFQIAYNDVKEFGGDPNADNTLLRRKTQTQRNGEELANLDENNETMKGIFWGYDASSNLCAPPRLYNMIAFKIAKDKQITDVIELAKLLTLVNVALADAGIGAWEAKYYYMYPRPVTLIRQIPANTFNGVEPNRFWTPLGAPVTNGTPESKNFTPPFPSYPSGHAVFGAALFQTMRRYFKIQVDDSTKFKFTSDEYNDKNNTVNGQERPLIDREFTFDSAERENGRSRIWLGIHWQFDADAGIEQGKKIADFIFDRLYKPVVVNP